MLSFENFDLIIALDEESCQILITWKELLFFLHSDYTSHTGDRSNCSLSAWTHTQAHKRFMIGVLVSLPTVFSKIALCKVEHRVLCQNIWQGKVHPQKHAYTHQVTQKQHTIRKPTHWSQIAARERQKKREKERKDIKSGAYKKQWFKQRG